MVSSVRTAQGPDNMLFFFYELLNLKAVLLQAGNSLYFIKSILTIFRKEKSMMTYSSGSQSGVPGPAARASPKLFIERPVLRLHSRPSDQKF